MLTLGSGEVGIDRKSKKNETNNNLTNIILPESWTNSITERPDASKNHLLTKSVFENIKFEILKQLVK